MIEEAVKAATSRGAHLVQLTSNKTRRDALEFYERMGFVATHEGFKRTLTYYTLTRGRLLNVVPLVAGMAARRSRDARVRR